MPTQPGRQVTLDDRFADIAARAPGFAGLWYDEAGALNVAVRRGARHAAVDAAVAAFIASRKSVDGTDSPAAPEPARFHEVTYDFLQLRDWKIALRHAWTRAGVVSFDIDEMRNRVVIGVDERANPASLRRLASLLGIPADGLEIEARQRVENLVDLRSLVRPTVGSIGVSGSSILPPDRLHDCTLNANIYYQGSAAFLTNSHCTSMPGVNYGTPAYNGGAHIGAEILDPAFGPIAGCPPGRYCRQADVAVYGYTPGVSWSFAQHAYVATGLNIINNSITSLDIGSNRPVLNERLTKTGQRTGRTVGPVIRTCVDETANQRPDLGGVIYLCQDWVRAHADNGDSGSPVHIVHLRSRGGVIHGYSTYYGILWGGNAARTEYVFSALGNIVNDIGSFQLR